METAPIRIVIVDDSPVYRRTIYNVLEKQPNMQVVAEAGDGLSAIQSIKIHRPDVVLMDVTMPIIHGLEATRRIKSQFPNVRVITLSMFDLKSISEAAYEAGACRCLTKGCSPKEITEAIMTAVYDTVPSVSAGNNKPPTRKSGLQDKAEGLKCSR